MRTRSRPRHKIAEPLRIEFHSQVQEDPPVATMTDNRTMAEMLRAPTEGYAEAIVVPPILPEQFELKHSLINMMTSEQLFGLKKDNPHDHVRWFNKITSTIKYRDVPTSSIKLILFPFSLAGAACRWLEKEPPHSITTWEDLVSKFINEFFPPSRTTSFRNEISNFEQKFGESFHEAWDRYKDLLRACPHHGFTELHQLNTFYNALNPTDQDSLNVAAGVNEQTSAMTTAMTAMLRQFQATPPLAPVKAVEETCVTCGGAHPYYQCLAAGGNTFPEFRDNIQEYVSAVAANYNQGNPGYRPQGVATQIRPPGFAQSNVQNNQNRLGPPQGYNRGNNFNQEPSMKVMQNQIDMVKNELRNEMKTSIQTSLSNQTNKIRDMMASFLQMNTASPSGLGTLPGNTVTNFKEDLKGITTRSGVAYQGHTTPTLSKVVKQGTEATKDQVQTPSPQSTAHVQPSVTQSETSGSEPIAAPVSASMPNLKQSIPYPSRRDNERRREQANEQIDKFYEIFKDMSFEISFTDALILMPKFASTLKALIGNKEKLSEMARTSMNEHCSTAILNKLPKKLGDPGKFLIPCEFSGMDECLALADLGASINLMPLSVWKELSLPELIPTCMTLELADRSVSKPIGITKDVKVKVGMFHFPADFVVVDFEPDPRVPLILGRCFLKTGRALIDVHKGELTLRIRNEAITYNMDQTSRYSANYDQMMTNKNNVTDEAYEEYFQKVL
nr:reverse transcriptase domain-containing protein [Tanacetum cinerariifolium]